MRVCCHENEQFLAGGGADAGQMEKVCEDEIEGLRWTYPHDEHKGRK